ncbi:amino acid transporter [Myriangium duriaei CBS 260.36]|uniref:Amino acid transporter n=1 Tax=Myriangium duriaei CBS 260.36 TaxID=1168546 RepID=A0A9P4J299_9PEZI|nr:amino acid transporter [Myriangium duriaei CBS 260.36]
MEKHQNLTDKERVPGEDDQERSAGDPSVGVVGDVRLERNFGFLSVCAVGAVTGNSWAVLGGSITLALANGGPPGVTYEFIVVQAFYWVITAVIAELASAIPSSAGVYHWAAITGGPKWGKALSWFAGWWNCWAWILAAASLASLLASQLLTMWMLFHPAYTPQPWNTFVAYILVGWICCGIVLFLNRSLPRINDLMLFLIVAGFIITSLVCAIMPSTTGSGHATSAQVWRDFPNSTGWPSGFAFLTGMLNGAFGTGAPDIVSHIAEEIPDARRNVPKGMAVQVVMGFVTGLLYLIAIFYSIHDFDAISTQGYPAPMGAIYQQATNSRGGSLGLLIVLFLPSLGCCIGCFITSGRMLYTLGRDGATPFSNWVGQVHPRYHNPFNSTLVVGVIITILAAIQVGNSTAFAAFVGSFVVLSTASYFAVIFPYLLTRRRHVRPGPFHLPNIFVYPAMVISCLYIMVTIVIFCFPTVYPFDAVSMNYTCVIFSGITVFMGILWFVKHTRGYEGPTEAVLREMHAGAGDGQDKR